MRPSLGGTGRKAPERKGWCSNAGTDFRRGAAACDLPPSLARCRDMALTSSPRTDAAGRMRRACREIASALLEMDGSGAGHDPGRVRRVIFDACSRYGLPRVPKNREILSAAASGMLDGSTAHDEYDDNNRSSGSSNSNSGGGVAQSAKASVT